MGLLLGAGDAPASLEQFIPTAWKAGPCPASYGRNSVLCAGTDTGPFKVDHHVPTLWIRAPGGGCKAAREASRRDSKQKGLTLVRETVGRCGSQAAPCVEHEIERCRAEAIANGRAPIGKVVIKWQIDANGRVASAEALSDDTKAPSLAGCLLARIRTWEFPRPKGGGLVFITCPFQFRPSD